MRLLGRTSGCISTADLEMCRRSTEHPPPIDKRLELRASSRSSLTRVYFLLAYSPATRWTTKCPTARCQVPRRSMTKSYSLLQRLPARSRVSDVLVWSASVGAKRAWPDISCQGRTSPHAKVPLQANPPIPSHPQQLDGPNADAQQPLLTLWITRPWDCTSIVLQDFDQITIEPWRQGIYLSGSAPPHYSTLPCWAVANRLHEDTCIAKV